MRARGRSGLVALGLLFVLAFAADASASGARARGDELSSDLMAAVRAAVAEESLDAVWCVPLPGSAEPAGWRASQRELGMRTFLRTSGIDVQPFSDAGWRWRARATRYGRDGALEPLVDATPTARGNVVVYEREELVEWYVNGEDGLEQGFTLLERPQSCGDAPLVLELALDTELSAEPCDGDRSVLFRDACGALVVSYRDLAAWDADGRQLDARVRMDGDHLSLVVDDANARYPLLVDPLIVVSETKLVPPVPPSDRYAWRVAIDGDTAAVGAYANEAYAFVRGVTGWAHQATFVTNGPASLDVDGDLLALGQIDTGTFISTGSVDVYRRTSGLWQFYRAIVNPHDASPSSAERFGQEISLDGSKIAILNGFDIDFGSRDPIYVYRFSPGLNDYRGEDVFTYGIPADGGFGTAFELRGDDLYGRNASTLVRFRFDAALSDWAFHSVIGSGFASISDIVLSDTDLLVVGDPLDDALATDAGAVHVFERFAGSWRETATLHSDLPTAGNNFGSRVAAHGALIFAGDRNRDELATDAGAVVVFARNGGWQPVDVLRASDAGSGGSQFFGTSLDASGAASGPGVQLVVGCFKGPFTGVPGAAYVLELEEPNPQVYCTSKITSLDCIPRIAFGGMPSASSATPFTISATSVINNANGIFFYGTSGRVATPFDGGLRCVAAPTRRAGPLDAGGNTGGPDCSGVLALDFNARIQSGVDPNLVPGAVVDGQFYFRDAGAATGTGLSEAIEFVVQP